MLIVFDKNTDTNIVSIISGDDTTGQPFNATQYYWSAESGNCILSDEVNFKLRVGNDDVVITFNSVEAMKPYIEQLFIVFATLAYPGTKGVIRDMYNDKPKTGAIVQHEYTFTDIEKTLLNK